MKDNLGFIFLRKKNEISMSALDSGAYTYIQIFLKMPRTIFPAAALVILDLMPI